jgi:hypothetical protein
MFHGSGYNVEVFLKKKQAGEFESYNWFGNPSTILLAFKRLCVG